MNYLFKLIKTFSLYEIFNGMILTLKYFLNQK